MISLKLGAAACLAILCGVSLFPSGRLLAQAPPGPLPPSQPLPPPPPRSAPRPKKQPQVEPRKTLAGFWKLNTEQSDDPQKKLEEARQTRAGSGGGPSGGSGGGGGRVGIGFPYPGAGGGGNGPYGGSGRGMGEEGSETTEQMRALIRPDLSQNFELKDAEVDATNDQGNKLVCYTDGRKIQKSKDDSLKQVSAHWESGQLITEEKGARGRKMSRTFELSSDGRQIYETWHIENGRSGSPIVIRYVYDAASEYPL
jgi:hypothetical protein